jgi:hypothetical protein
LVQRKRLLEFGDTFGRVVCKDVDDAQSQVGTAKSGAIDRALVEAASAAANRAVRSSVRKLPPIKQSTSAVPTSASTFPGSRAKARPKKPCACPKFPLFTLALPRKYKSIVSGCIGSEKNQIRAERHWDRRGRLPRAKNQKAAPANCLNCSAPHRQRCSRVQRP